MSHLAITDETGDRFLYGQRLVVGPQVDRSPLGPDGTPTGFDLSLVAGGDPSRPGALGRAGRGRWPAARPRSADGDRWRRTEAAAHAGSPGGLGLDLDLTATKPPALHGGDGWIDFGPAGGSYYYSRTAMDATGS